MADGEELNKLSENAIAVAAGEGERELREQQTVGRPDVVAATGDGKREITTAGSERVQRGGESERVVGCCGVLLVEDIEKIWSEHVQTEEA